MLIHKQIGSRKTATPPTRSEDRLYTQQFHVSVGDGALVRRYDELYTLADLAVEVDALAEERG